MRLLVLSAGVEVECLPSKMILLVLRRTVVAMRTVEPTVAIGTRLPYVLVWPTLNSSGESACLMCKDGMLSCAIILVTSGDVLI